jgi:hypothetical protein
MKRCLGLAVVVVGASLAAACQGGASMDSAGSGPASTGHSVGAARGDVPLTETGRLVRVWEEGGLQFGPPPAGQPNLGPAAAVVASRHHTGRSPSGAREVSAVYATLTDATHDAVPVWLVTYTGDVCIPIIGGASIQGGGAGSKPRSTQPAAGGTSSMVPRDCYPSPLITIVNATSGYRIMSFADGHTDPGSMISPQP